MIGRFDRLSGDHLAISELRSPARPWIVEQLTWWIADVLMLGSADDIVYAASRSSLERFRQVSGLRMTVSPPRADRSKRAEVVPRGVPQADGDPRPDAASAVGRPIATTVIPKSHGLSLPRNHRQRLSLSLTGPTPSSPVALPRPISKHS